MQATYDVPERQQTSASTIMPQEALPAIQALCSRYGVLFLDLFGSANSGDFDPSRSDLDFVVEFIDLPGSGRADAYFALHDELEQLFGRRVDLLTDRSIRNPYLRRSIDKNHQRLFTRS
ncbi:nucleotidyltransferase family protein [Acidisphaera sp. L21]|uniref:nucleotidyltransferase family protein n=1 Tax=Acidisphaera sp. L21 TaxID=1641851 RepID=UPI001C2020CF|nr:nucleotidyltransferase domain-containing protein [Acidisphaera sp. L21]